IKLSRSSCRVIGVEPAGADSMRRSLAANEPQTLSAVDTIADSLGAPFALDFSFAHCRHFVDDVVIVSDADIRAAMRIIRDELGFSVEPACAATTAAALGPLVGQLDGNNTVLLFCGSNIDSLSADAIISAE
ncbi:MAG: pyridoxal-phosphate dependent enzyme, partial [Pseudomonadota bacterium]